MKLGFLIALISLFSLVSCVQNNEVTQSDPDSSINPMRCLETQDNSCSTVWKMTFAKDKFPANVGIYINDKVIFDECNRNPKIAIERRLDTVEITLWNYNNLKGDEQFKLALYDLGTCYEPKKDYYLNANQSYKIKEIGGQKYVTINVGN